MNPNELNDEFWSKRYKDNQTGWDIGYCSTPLKTYFENLADRNITVLIPGAGYGHEAIFLHELGFQHVTVIDLAAEPLEEIQRRCPTFPKNQLLQGDFFEHHGQYDLIIEQTFFCAIDPDLRKKYVEKMRSLLKPEGKLIGVLFNREFEGGPPFGGNMEDYKSLFSEFFEEVSIEPCYNSIPERLGSEAFIQIS